MLRSLMLGDCLHYASPYMRGVAQAMGLLGHWHEEVSIRQPLDLIARRVCAGRPHILWTHMLLWPPPGSPAVADLVAVVEEAARAGARVLIHDGDAKERTRHPHGIAGWCSLALVNHGYDRSAWGCPTLRWPYFAMAQREIATPDPALACDLFFAGRRGGETYSARDKLLADVRARGVRLRSPAPGENTLDRTAVIAASVGAVLGFGRPDVPGWVDTRVTQYPGAGGILIHDDAGGLLTSGEHFLLYTSGSADSVVEAVERVKAMSEAERWGLRRRAFAHVQEHHSSVARVKQVLQAVGLWR